MTPSGIPAAARRVADASARSVRELTPGQRWTSGLMVGLALVVLAFGLPGATRTVLPAAARGAAAPPATGEGVVPSPVPPFTEAIVQPARSFPSAPETTVLPQGDDVLGSLTDGATTVSVAALYDPAAGVGDRTDEAMAKRFMATAGVAATFVPIGDSTTTCAAVKDVTLVVAGGTLPPEIRTCLRLAGIMSLSFDDDVPLGPVDRAVSTRRGAAQSLLDTASLAAGQLKGHLGLVADERLRATLSDLVPAVRAAGLDITSTTWLKAGDNPAGVAVSLAGEGLSGVLFATSTQNQSTIGSQLRTLAPGIWLVVLDAADSITSSSYPPLFDGALAATSVQLPWHPGAEQQRAACRATWESAQTPPAILNDDELLRALTWCQHAAMAAAAAERAPAVGLRTAMLLLEVTSPITSALARLSDGGFGPTEITLATWGAACGCWSSSTPFAPPGSTHG